MGLLRWTRRPLDIRDQLDLGLDRLGTVETSFLIRSRTEVRPKRLFSVVVYRSRNLVFIKVDWVASVTTGSGICFLCFLGQGKIMFGFRLLYCCGARFIWRDGDFFRAEMFVNDWVEVRFLRQQVQIVHQVSEILSVTSWLGGPGLWRGTYVGGCARLWLSTTSTLLVSRFGGLVQNDWLSFFMHWERAAACRLAGVAWGALFGFLRFILRRLYGIACFLGSTSRRATRSMGHHVLLIGVVLQLLLDIRNVERRRIDHPLRYVLVRFDVACI